MRCVTLNEGACFTAQTGELLANRVDGQRPAARHGPKVAEVRTTGSGRRGDTAGVVAVGHSVAVSVSDRCRSDVQPTASYAQRRRPDAVRSPRVKATGLCRHRHNPRQEEAESQRTRAISQSSSIAHISPKLVELSVLVNKMAGLFQQIKLKS